MSRCIICGKEVDWTKITDEFSYIIDRVDTYGEDALTEHEQVIYHGMCCSRECYKRLQ